MPCIVGVDFDNTLVSYDAVMHKAACDLGFISQDVEKDKKTIRDEIRQLPEGEAKWQKLQAIVYGEAMDDAVLISGVEQFFRHCKEHQLPTYIISHKGEFAAADEHNINLRDAAMHWMEKNKFFSNDGLGLSPENIYFEPTRRGKVERIKAMQCTEFIDDLEETFLEDTFPRDVHKILFAPSRRESKISDVSVFSNWGEINEYFNSKS